ncbi:hypothetical protein GCM10009835_36120 [Planosporangium flavigriseum]
MPARAGRRRPSDLVLIRSLRHTFIEVAAWRPVLSGKGGNAAPSLREIDGPSWQHPGHGEGGQAGLLVAGLVER